MTTFDDSAKQEHAEPVDQHESGGRWDGQQIGRTGLAVAKVSGPSHPCGSCKVSIYN